MNGDHVGRSVCRLFQRAGVTYSECTDHCTRAAASIHCLRQKVAYRSFSVGSCNPDNLQVMLVMVDDDRFQLEPGEVPVERSIRFRTLGCYPLTGAVESTAKTLPEVIQEMLLTTTSERQGRAIDKDASATMEKKKQEGYF